PYITESFSLSLLDALPISIAHAPAWTFVLGFAAGGLVVLWFVSPPPPHSGSTTAPRSTAGIEPGEPRGAPSAGGGSRAASAAREDRKSTRLNSSHVKISYA